MMRHDTSSVCRGLAVFITGLMLLAPRAGQGDALSGYTVKMIARDGDAFAGRSFDHGFHVGQLNDNGQIAFVTGDPGQGDGALVQYSDGQFIPVAVAGGPAPYGQTWPADLGFWSPVSMNESGDIAFAAGMEGDVYFWDAKAQSVAPIALPGMAAANSLTFAAGGNHGSATINNRDEIAFIGWVPQGAQVRSGVFVRRADGKIQAVSLPGDTLPGRAGRLVDAGDTGINDAGTISFAAFGTQGPPNKIYLWENGTTRVVVDSGTALPGFGKYFGGIHFGVNNQDSVLIDAVVKDNSPFGMFLWKAGQFTTVLLPDQLLPGGGNYDGDPFPDPGHPNDAGQYPLILPVNENGASESSAVIVGEDGKVTLVVKDGMTTDLGTITHLGGNHSGGIALNSRGQVALTAQIDNGPDFLLLLTPKTP